MEITESYLEELEASYTRIYDDFCTEHESEPEEETALQRGFLLGKTVAITLLLKELLK